MSKLPVNKIVFVDSTRLALLRVSIKFSSVILESFRFSAKSFKVRTISERDWFLGAYVKKLCFPAEISILCSISRSSARFSEFPVNKKEPVSLIRLAFSITSISPAAA